MKTGVPALKTRAAELKPGQWAMAMAAAGGRGVDPVAQEEAWREVDMQQETIFDLTERMQQLQQEMGIDMDRGPESELGQVTPG